MKLPQAFIDCTAPLLGDAFSSFVESLSTISPSSIRINLAKTDAVFSYAKVPWCSTGHYLSQRPSFTLDPLLHAGVYYVQEAGSMFLEQVLTQLVHKPATMLDLCAAPGGKATHLISLLPKDSMLIANEFVRSRAYILAENLQKWGNPNVLVSNNSPADFSALKGFFDHILVDAPCSGEGMFRKDPKAIDEWSPANVSQCVRRQQSLLQEVWPALKTNGLLIYSTCTYNREENELMVLWMKEALGAELVRIKIDEAWGVTETDAGYRFYPHKTKAEGFFMAVLRKTQEENTLKIKQDKQPDKPSKQQTDLLGYLLNSEDYTLVSTKEKVWAVPSIYADKMNFLQKKMKLIYAGIPLADIKGKDLIPDTGLALSTALNRAQCVSVDVDWQTAIAFLRTENIVLTDMPKGFVLICYKGFPLGWVKNLGNRCNVLYPSEWRIRMQLPKDAVDPNNLGL